jgi:hypothetical protein
MNATRWLMAVAFCMLGSTWAQASTIAPNPFGPYFNIQLYADDGSSWAAGEVFTVTATDTSLTTLQADQEGFTENQFCPDGDWESCTCDPGVKAEGGSDPIQFNLDEPAGTYTITTGSNGTATADYVNVGPNIQTLMLSTTITTEQENETYSCSSDLFQYCGFKITGDPTLGIIFTDPIYAGGIPTAVPEPTPDLLLLIALGGVIVAPRIRARRSVA